MSTLSPEQRYGRKTADEINNVLVKHGKVSFIFFPGMIKLYVVAIDVSCWL